MTQKKQETLLPLSCLCQVPGGGGDITEGILAALGWALALRASRLCIFLREEKEWARRHWQQISHIYRQVQRPGCLAGKELLSPTLTSCSNGLTANRLPRILYAFTPLLPFSFSLLYRNSLKSQSDHIRHLLKIVTEKVKSPLQWRMHPLPQCLSNSMLCPSVT